MNLNSGKSLVQNIDFKDFPGSFQFRFFYFHWQKVVELPGMLKTLSDIFSCGPCCHYPGPCRMQTLWMSDRICWILFRMLHCTVSTTVYYSLLQSTTVYYSLLQSTTVYYSQLWQIISAWILVQNFPNFGQSCLNSPKIQVNSNIDKYIYI